MSELDDFFNSLLGPDKKEEEEKPKNPYWKPEGGLDFGKMLEDGKIGKPAKEEPEEKVYTWEELSVIGEELSKKEPEPVVVPEKEDFGGIDFGAMFDEMVAEQKETEKEIEAEIARELTALEQAKSDAEAAEKMEEEAREARETLRLRYKEAMALAEAIRKEFDEQSTVYNMLAQQKHAALNRVSEEEHRLAEEQREKEINDKRLVVVAGFKNHIDELNPAWKNIAFDHQWEGATTLALHGSGLLGDDMGLGKTMTIIMTLDMVQAHRTLIVTPSDVAENFTLECMMWSPHRFTMTLANSDPTERKALMNMIFKKRMEQGKDFILTINREQLYNADFVQQLKDLRFDTIIVDEFHEAKNLKGSYFDALETLRYGYHDENWTEETSVQHFFPLTGTFILNEPQDIFPALYLVDKQAFPNKRDFLEFYCEQDYYSGKWKFRSGGVTSLMKNLGGRMVVRTMEEAGIKLPTQHIHDESPQHLEVCEECREQFPITFASGAYLDQRKVMKQLAEHSQIILDNNRKTSVIEQIALITRQRQAVVWPGGIKLIGEYEDGTPFEFSVGEDVQESIKVDWVEWKIRQKLAQGKRVVVFSQFATGLTELEKRLSDIAVVRYDGSTPQSLKSEVKRDFDRRFVDNHNGEYQWDVVLANFKTGGVGLNFTHATEMVMLDEEWNPGKNEQAYRRTKRMGQTEETHVWIPRVKGSIDLWMKELNDRKRSMIDGFNLEADMSKDFHSFLDTVKGL